MIGAEGERALGIPRDALDPFSEQFIEISGERTPATADPQDKLPSESSITRAELSSIGERGEHGLEKGVSVEELTKRFPGDLTRRAYRLSVWYK